MARSSSRLKAKAAEQTQEQNISAVRETRSRCRTSQPEKKKLTDTKSEVEGAEDTGEKFCEVMLGAIKEEVLVKVEADDYEFQECTNESEYPSTYEEGVLDQNDSARRNTFPSIRRKRTTSRKTLNTNPSFEPFIIYNNDKSYKCALCSIQVFKRNSLMLHLLSKHSEICKMGVGKAYKCNLCKHYFPNKQLLKVHKINHCASGSFKCSECSKSFNQKQLLTEHMQWHSGQRPFQCEVCSMAFFSKRKLRRHEESHMIEDCICDVCSKTFKNKTQLQKHVGRMHKGQGIFTCSICGKSVKGHALSHLRIHLNEKQFKCKYCNMRFIQSSQLNVHIRTHTGDRPYPCEVCNVSFAHSSALRVHMRIHTGEKPAKCMLCPAAFSQLPHLKKHMRCIHKTKKPYVCVPCMAFFHTKVELGDHISSNGCPEVSPPRQSATVSHIDSDFDMIEEEERVDDPEVLQSDLVREQVVIKKEILEEDSPLVE